MNRVILAIDKLLPSAEVNKLLQSSKQVSYDANTTLVSTFDNVRKVYHVVDGCLVIRVENRYRRLLLAIDQQGIDNVTPSDVVMANDIDAKIEYRAGAFALFEHCLYEQLFPMTLYCKEASTIIEIDGNLFKAMFHGIFMLI